MSILSATRAWFAKFRKGYYPGPRGEGKPVAGAGSGLPVANLDAYESAYQVNVQIHRGVSVIAETCADVPLKLYEWKKVDGDMQAVEVTDHPALDLLDHPRPRVSGWTLKRDTISHLYLSGEGFWFVENGTTGTSLLPADPKYLQLLKPRFIADVNVSDAGDVWSYVYRQKGDEHDYDAEFITHFKTFSPRDDMRGLSIIEVAQTPVLLNWYMGRHNALFFKHGANPGVVFSTDQMVKDVEPMTRAWTKAHRGVDNAFKTAFLTGGFKPLPISVSAKDGEFINLAKFSRDDVLMLLGIPPVIVGVLQDVNYATSKEQTRIFYQHTIQPVLRLFCDTLNTQFIRVWYRADYERRGIFLAPDYSGIEALQTDKKMQADTLNVYVSGGIMTPNEAREDINLSPLDGGDELRQSNSGFGGLLSPRPPTNLRAVIPPTRVDQWKARNSDFLEGERKIERAMVQFFTEQSERVVVALETQKVLAGPAPSHVREIDLVSLFDLDSENQELLALLMPIILDIMEQAGNGALAAVGSGAQFKITDPRVQAFLAKKELKITAINDTTLEAIRAILEDASAEGVGVGEMSSRIRDEFSDFSKVRADTIARTETVGANNAAAIEGYHQSEVVAKKEWLSSGDDRVRPSHQIDGEQVPLDGVFSNGMKYPGDPDAPPEETINDRCTVLPVLED